MPTREPTYLRSGGALIICALVVSALNVAIDWPGALTPDSQNQLNQVATGYYTDWHPPLMARVWALFGGQVSAMLLLQVGLHWLGFWALAETLRRERPQAWAWAMLAVGITPISLRYTGVIQKDTLLASLMISAFGIIALTGKLKAGLGFGVAGMLIRANGVFALPSILLIRFARIQLLTATAMCVASGVALVPLSSFFNHNLLGAQKTGVERSLQLFDLAGIARYSGDSSILPPGAEPAERCYTPLFWDTLNMPRCGGPLAKLPHSMTGTWLRAIADHPIAYAQHRILHFNRTTFFMVPAMQQCVDAPAFHYCDFSARAYIGDFLTKNAFLWPATWLMVGIVLLFGDLHPVSRALTMSSVLYGLAYLFVGVAADFRYFYWSEIAVQAAIVFHLGHGRRLSHPKRLVVAVAAIWALGYGTRYIVYHVPAFGA